MSVQEAFRRKLHQFRQINNTHMFLEGRGLMEEFEDIVGPLFDEASHSKALLLKEHLKVITGTLSNF